MTDLNPCDEEGTPDTDHRPLRQGQFPVSVAPVKKRHGSLLPWVLAAAFVIAMLAWVWMVHGAMSKLERRLAVPAVDRSTAVLSEQQQQIQSFETRLARVLGASVESKLRTLERSVERGSLTPEELRLIEATANELRLLQSNPTALGEATREVKDHPRYQAVAADEMQDLPDAMMAEIAALRKAYYAALIGLVLCMLMAAGLWFNARRRHRLIEVPAQPRVPLIHRLMEDRRR